eukprot:403374312
MNDLMKDQDYFESELDKEEIAELRDSLLQPAQTSSQNVNARNIQLVKQSDSDKDFVLSDQIPLVIENKEKLLQQLPAHLQPLIDDYKTPKNMMMGYHKRKQTGQQELMSIGSDAATSNQSLPSWTLINQKKANSNFAYSSTNLMLQKGDSKNISERETVDYLPDELPGLEHQDTIVRQPSSTSNFSLTNESFFKAITQAINHFEKPDYANIMQKQINQSAEMQVPIKAQDAIQKQLVNENEELKRQVGQLHHKIITLQNQNKASKKELVNQINQMRQQQEQTDQTALVNQLHSKIQKLKSKCFESQEQLKFHIQERERVEIAYKRYISKLDSQRNMPSDYDQVNIVLQSQSFLSNSSNNPLFNRRSPSPHLNMNMLQNNSYLRSSGGQEFAIDYQQQQINELRNQLEKKQQEIFYFKNEQNNMQQLQQQITPLSNKDQHPHQVLTSSVHLNSEENILDDLEDESNPYLRYKSGSQANHQSANMINDHDTDEQITLQQLQSNQQQMQLQYQMTHNSSSNDYTPYKLSASTAATNVSNNFQSGQIDVKQSYSNTRRPMISGVKQSQQHHTQQHQNILHSSNQFYSYERRSQSPLIQSTQFPSNQSQNGGNNLIQIPQRQQFAADRTHSPQQLYQAFKTQNPTLQNINSNNMLKQSQNFNQLTQSSYSSNSVMTQHSNIKGYSQPTVESAISNGSFLKNHNNSMIKQGMQQLKSTHQSPKTQQIYQQKQKQLGQTNLNSLHHTPMHQQQIGFSVAPNNHIINSHAYGSTGGPNNTQTNSTTVGDQFADDDIILNSDQSHQQQPLRIARNLNNISESKNNFSSNPIVQNSKLHKKLSQQPNKMQYMHTQGSFHAPSQSQQNPVIQNNSSMTANNKKIAGSVLPIQKKQIIQKQKSKIVNNYHHQPLMSAPAFNGDENGDSDLDEI